jgi:uncharacterized coiled-coil protein SlyX
MGMEEVPVFEPRWLFHPTRDDELVETQEMYDHLMSQGGWVHTPAELGRITAPNREQTAMMRQAQTPAAPATPGPASVPSSDHRVADLETEIETLHKVLEDQMARMQQMQAELVVLRSQMDDLDQKMAPSGGKK